MVPPTQTSRTKHSPSAELEQTFNEMGMNSRDSPGNITFSPNLQFANNGFVFGGSDPINATLTPKRLSNSTSKLASADASKPSLYLHHKSVKSRVETQIPINMIMSPLPAGIKKLRLPPHTVAKPKFFAKAESERSSDTLELNTSLVCSSAMQDIRKFERALARARGEEIEPPSRASPASSNDSGSTKDDEERPLNGGEVKICPGCIARERKRNSRKKTKKPEEEEMFQKDEEKRVIVFNTNEIKEWHAPALDDDETRNAQIAYTPAAGFPAGSMQVDLPMRIACYCRHQSEKIGFIVIFTIKDWKDNIIGQASTQSIMITDDHKTNNVPPHFTNPTSSISSASHYPGAGVFPTSTFDTSGFPPIGHRPFKTSLSTTDLSSLQSNLDPQYPINPSPNPFVTPVSTNTSATLTPKNLSRPASPTITPGPNNKRRKHSGTGKIPSNLAMTRLETSLAPSNLPNSAISSPYTPQLPSYPNDLGYAMPTSRNGPIKTSPPTPNSNDYGFVAAVNRSFSMENLPRQAMMSAPNSRQPSRPNSPVSNRNSFNQTDATVATGVNTNNFSQTRRVPPLIHKIVPAEGSVTGGQEVTLLGNGFYQGLEVVFGDVEATTTTYWGDKTLMCLTPPSHQPGSVPVILKHEHPLYSQRPRQNQPRQVTFTYVDDTELSIYKLAMRTLGRSMTHPTDDPLTAAQQLLSGTPGGSSSNWTFQGPGYNAGIQHRSTTGEAIDVAELENNMLRFLNLLDNVSMSRRPRLELCLPSGQSLLHLASLLGLTRFAVGLVLRGASLDCLDRNGNTPMHLAALHGHYHIVHRLRLAGADNKIRNLRNFLPADLALSKLGRQAAVMPRHHYRARSTGGTPLGLQSRMHSFTSLGSSTDSKLHNHSPQDSLDMSEHALSKEDVSISPIDISAKALSRRPSLQLELRRLGSSQTPSRRPSDHEPAPPNSMTDATAIASPAAQMMAWRDQIIAQIHQYQQSTHHLLVNFPTFPNLPNLPTMPDYQTHPMVRRVSSLFPQRIVSRQDNVQNTRESWWDSFTGSSPPAAGAPPAYEDLYPDRENDDHFTLKKTSAFQAAADAAIDRHFESSSNFDVVQTSKSSSEAAKGSRDPPRLELQPTESSRKLFFIWVSEMFKASIDYGLTWCRWQLLFSSSPGCSKMMYRIFLYLLLEAYGDSGRLSEIDVALLELREWCFGRNVVIGTYGSNGRCSVSRGALGSMGNFQSKG